MPTRQLPLAGLAAAQRVEERQQFIQRRIFERRELSVFVETDAHYWSRTIRNANTAASIAIPRLETGRLA
jgi:hypothetical protein